MKSYTQHLFQWVWGTKMHENTLFEKERKDLYRYIFGILKNKSCYVYRINGTENHIHIITSLHPSLCVSSMIKDIKLASTEFIKRQKIFPYFKGWQDGYGSFTYSKPSMKRLIDYVENQQQHHRKKTFKEEIKDLLEEHGIEYDERYLI